MTPDTAAASVGLVGSATCPACGDPVPNATTEPWKCSCTPMVTFDASLPDAVNTLTQAIGDVDTLSFTYLAEHPDDEVALLAFLACVRAQRMRLAQVEAVLEASAVKVMGAERVEIVGIGVFERRGGSERKEWEHERLAAEVVRAAVVTADGEVPDEAAMTAAYAVRDHLLSAAAVTYWRVGILKQLGINANDYCVRSPGRRTVQVTFPDNPS